MPTTDSISPRAAAAVACVVCALCFGPDARGQTKGQLSYNPDKDAAFLIIDGREDNRAIRLSVDGEENLRGFLELYRDGARAALVYADAQSEGGLRLSSLSGDAVQLFVDDGSSSGILFLNRRGGDTRVRLFVDDDGRGQLRLDGDGNDNRASLYVDAADQGGLRLADDDGAATVRLYVEDDSDAGVLALGNGSGESRAVLRVTDDGRGLLVIDGAGDATRAILYADSEDQGGLRLHDDDGAAIARLFVDDTSDAGVLALADGDGSDRAVLRVTDDGTGLLVIDGASGGARATLYADALDQGGLALRDQTGGRRADLFVQDASQGGMLRLRNATGQVTILLDGGSGTVSKTGVNGFLIDHPKAVGKQIFYASLEGPEAGMYVRGSARLEGGTASVRLPEHFAAVARAGTLTVQITPTTTKTRGLAVTKKGRDGFVVEELGDGEGAATFDWVAFAERGDIRPIEVVRTTPTSVSDTETPDRLSRASTGAQGGDEIGSDTGADRAVAAEALSADSARDVDAQLSGAHAALTRRGDAIEQPTDFAPDTGAPDGSADGAERE